MREKINPFIVCTLFFSNTCIFWNCVVLFLVGSIGMIFAPLHLLSVILVFAVNCKYLQMLLQCSYKKHNFSADLIAVAAVRIQKWFLLITLLLQIRLSLGYGSLLALGLRFYGRVKLWWAGLKSNVLKSNSNYDKRGEGGEGCCDLTSCMWKIRSQYKVIF